MHLYSLELNNSNKLTDIQLEQLNMKDKEMGTFYENCSMYAHTHTHTHTEI
jgi:hypothetical protein